MICFDTSKLSKIGTLPLYNLTISLFSVQWSGYIRAPLRTPSDHPHKCCLNDPFNRSRIIVVVRLSSLRINAGPELFRIPANTLSHRRINDRISASISSLGCPIAAVRIITPKLFGRMSTQSVSIFFAPRSSDFLRYEYFGGEWNQHDVTPGQRDVAGQTGPLGRDRLFGNLSQDLLARRDTLRYLSVFGQGLIQT